MNCPNCGAELIDSVKFCRECGSKVELPKIRFCRECGSELVGWVKFCSNCGAKIVSLEEIAGSQVQKSNVTAPETPGHTIDNRNSDPVHNKNNAVQSFTDKATSTPQETISTVSSNISNNANKSSKNKKTSLIAVAGVLVLLLIIVLLLNNTGSGEKNTSTSSEISTIASAPTNYVIEKGSEYAFMSDEWNVYIATAISDQIIKIEHWDKTLSSTKKLKYSSDIGSYKINDPENGFYWVDDEHTAFGFIFSDSDNSRVKKAAAHIFTIDINDNDKFKGSDFDEKIACYSYANDDWHMYRAIPLTENFIKIECWARSSSTDSFCFGWDWCVIDTRSTEMEFEWTDNEHTSFTIVAQDPKNDYYWKTATFVVFELENLNYTYSNVREYLDACGGVVSTGD